MSARPSIGPSGQRRVPISLRMDPVVLEALDETARELVMGRNVIVERAVTEYLERLELPDRQEAR